jgi:fatty-acyl-CoA synthase
VGMAALVLQPGAQFDPLTFYAHTEQLPAYARPLFVRIVSAMDVTGTLKQRKIDLQRQGYAPDATNDPLYFRDDGQRRYVPLTTALLEKIRSGTLGL